MFGTVRTIFSSRVKVSLGLNGVFINALNAPSDLETFWLFWILLQRQCYILVNTSLLDDGGGGGRWDSQGCYKFGDSEDPNVVRCACDHFTNFALLLSPQQQVRLKRS